MLNTVLLLIAQYDNHYPEDHSKNEWFFILHFKPFLGHLIISNIKTNKNFFRSKERL